MKEVKEVKDFKSNKGNDNHTSYKSNKHEIKVVRNFKSNEDNKKHTSYKSNKSNPTNKSNYTGIDPKQSFFFLIDAEARTCEVVQVPWFYFSITMRREQARSSGLLGFLLQ